MKRKSTKDETGFGAAPNLDQEEFNKSQESLTEKTARRPARRPSRVVQEEATRTKPVVQDKYSEILKKVEKAVEEKYSRLLKTDQSLIKSQRFSLTAGSKKPSMSQGNPEKAFEPSPELLDRYAREQRP